MKNLPANVESEPVDLYAHYKAMPLEEVRTAFMHRLSYGADNFLHMAFQIRVLEEAGEDLSTLKIGGLLHYLRKIPKQLHPALLARFNGRRNLLNRLSNLRMEEQELYAGGERVLVIFRSTNGYEGRMCALEDLGQKEIAQLFDGPHIRDKGEQIVWLDKRRGKKVIDVPEEVGGFLIDAELLQATPKRKQAFTLPALKAAVRALEMATNQSE